MHCSMPGLSVPHHLPKFAQVHVHCIGDTIQPFHPLMPSSPSALSLSQHLGLVSNMSPQKGTHRAKKIFEDSKASNFPYLVKDRRLQIPNSQQIQNITKLNFKKILLFKKHH
ncbi:unnamed protein product [Rangifer tarandus platyrhynchus]|uniref:Uncharacterized protein n=1 Tax=Rangifer tarandus platyrhynchus TaxID=3082113 RepID=A0AC59ZSU8_RANTA